MNKVMTANIIYNFLLLGIFPLKAQQNARPSSEKKPGLQETADWLNEKYNKFEFDSLIMEGGWWSKNIDARTVQTFDHFHYSLPLGFRIDDRYLRFTVSDSYLEDHSAISHTYGKTKPVIYIIDLATVDTIRLGVKQERKGENDPDKGTGSDTDFGNNRIEFKTKGDLNSIEVEDEYGKKSKTAIAFIPTIKQEEIDLQNRFLKALKYYCALCKRKYPPRKEIF
jgi:hypothetical protein